MTLFHPLLCPVQSQQPPYEGGIHPVIQMRMHLRGIEQHGQWENIQQNPLRALDRHTQKNCNQCFYFYFVLLLLFTKTAHSGGVQAGISGFGQLQEIMCNLQYSSGVRGTVLESAEPGSLHSGLTVLCDKWIGVCGWGDPVRATQWNSNPGAGVI